MRTQQRLVAGAVMLLALYAAWRVTLGASTADDAHVVGLALRMAQGAKPFVDEWNVQALGSLIAVPFTWLWTHTVGITGLMVASRAFYCALAFGVGYACYRALRPSFGVLASAVAVAAPLLAPPYNILNVSYNTGAMLGFLVAVCAAFAAVRDDSRAWAFWSGVATGVAVVSYPPMLAAGVVMLGMVAIVAWRRGRGRVPGALAAGVATVAVPFAVWLAFSIGVAPIRDTLAFTREYTASRRQPGLHARRLVDAYSLALVGPATLPVIGLVALASLKRFSPRTRSLAACAMPLAAAVPGVVHLVRTGNYMFFGTLTSAYLLILIAWMAVPVIVWMRRSGPSELRTLLWIALPASLAGGLAVSAATSSNVWWAMPIVGLAPLVTALVLGWSLMIAEDWPEALPWASGMLVVMLVVFLTLIPFRNPFPWTLHERLTSGAWAGTRANRVKGGQIRAITMAGKRWVPAAGKVLFMGAPGAYLLVDATADTNIEWLGEFGQAARWTVRYIDERGGAPDTVFIAGEYVHAAGGFERLRRQDPLVEYVLRSYRLVGNSASLYVFQRKR